MMMNIVCQKKQADCSGRALATLVIAWVGAALVASVLLKWTHMWVSLAVLTLLFLVACGYAAYDARKTQERVLARETERQEERRRRREQQLESVSGGVDNYPEVRSVQLLKSRLLQKLIQIQVIDPPEYQTFWVPDLPPSYNAVVSTQPASSVVDPEVPAVLPPRLSNPPPYAVAVQSEPLFLPIVQNQSGGEVTQTPVVPPPAGGQNIVEGGQTSSQTIDEQDQDKIEEPRPARTHNQYLTSILNSTFGRNARRNEQGTTNEAQNNRNREQSLVSSSNSNDRIINSNNTNGPPPQYPVTLRLSGSYSSC